MEKLLNESNCSTDLTSRIASAPVREVDGAGSSGYLKSEKPVVSIPSYRFSRATWNCRNVLLSELMLKCFFDRGA